MIKEVLMLITISGDSGYSNAITAVETTRLACVEAQKSLSEKKPFNHNNNHPRFNRGRYYIDCIPLE